MGKAKRLMRIGEAAKLLGVSPSTIHRWAEAGKLRYFEVGPYKHRRFLEDDLLALVAERGADQPAKEPEEE